MSEISVVNSSTFWNKMRRTLKATLATGMLLGGIYGGIFAAPKIHNQLNLESGKEILENKVKEGEYESALEAFEGVSKRGFIIPGTEKKLKGWLEDEVRWAKQGEFNDLIYSNDYSGAEALIGGFKEENFFSEPEISDLEQRVAGIHPEKLAEKADNSNKTSERLKLYQIAEREAKESGLEICNLTNKIVETSLLDIVSNYDSLIETERSIRANVNPNSLKDYQQAQSQIDSLPVSSVLSRFKDLIIYLGSPNMEADVDESVVDLFLDSSNRFLAGYLLGRDKDIGAVRIYLDNFNELSRKLGVKDLESRMEGLTDNLVSYASSKIKTTPNCGHSELKFLDTAIGVVGTYNPEKLGKIVDLYFEESDNKLFLDSALFYSQLLPEGKMGEVRKKVAQGYVELAESMQGKDCYFYLETARGLYISCGISPGSPELTHLDRISQTKLNQELSLQRPDSLN